MSLQEERELMKAEELTLKAELEEAGTPVTCKDCCSACCYTKVRSTETEVADIISKRSFSEDEIAILKAQVDGWEVAEHACVLLEENGNCSMHDITKPLRCISHLTCCPSSGCVQGITGPVSKVIAFPKSANRRIRDFEKSDKVVVLHEELYKQLTN